MCPLRYAPSKSVVAGAIQLRYSGRLQTNEQHVKSDKTN